VQVQAEVELVVVVEVRLVVRLVVLHFRHKLQLLHSKLIPFHIGICLPK